MENKTYIANISGTKHSYWSSNMLITERHRIYFGCTEDAVDNNGFSRFIYNPYLIYLRKIYEKNDI